MRARPRQANPLAAGAGLDGARGGVFADLQLGPRETPTRRPEPGLAACAHSCFLPALSSDYLRGFNGMSCVRTEVLEGVRRVVLWANTNGCGGCATGRGSLSCLFLAMEPYLWKRQEGGRV